MATSQIIHLTPRNDFSARLPMSIGTPVTTPPSVMASAMPLAITSMPKVAMNDGTSSLVTTNPLTAPMAMPTASAATIPSSTECWSRITVAASTLTRPTPEPTDRSSSPARMTNVTPKATSYARIDPCVSRFVMFSVVRKYGLAMLK